MPTVVTEFSLLRRSPLLEPRRPIIAAAAGSMAGLLAALADGGHWFAAAVIVAMAADLLLVLIFILRLTKSKMRQLFEAADLKRGRLLRRALLIFLISVIFLVFSVQRIPLVPNSEKPLHLRIYFIGVMLCWLQLQLAFAI